MPRRVSFLRVELSGKLRLLGPTLTESLRVRTISNAWSTITTARTSSVGSPPACRVLHGAREDRFLAASLDRTDGHVEHFLVVGQARLRDRLAEVASHRRRSVAPDSSIPPRTSHQSSRALVARTATLSHSCGGWPRGSPGFGTGEEYGGPAASRSQKTGQAERDGRGGDRSRISPAERITPPTSQRLRRPKLLKKVANGESDHPVVRRLRGGLRVFQKCTRALAPQRRAECK